MTPSRYTAKNYCVAASLEEAYTLNQKRSNTIVSGNLWLKMQNRSFDTLIDLSGLGLNSIEETETAFVIGCMATLRQLETNSGLNAYFDGAPKAAVEHIVGVQFRNCATVGGSVWGRFGFSDVLTLLLALDTTVELHHAGRMPLAEFVKRPYDNDILVRIIVAKDGRRVNYRSARNTKTDFPTLAVAAAIRKNQAYVSIGARPAKAVLHTLPVTDAETMARAVQAKTDCGGNMRADADYRKHLAYVLTRRALNALMKEGTEC